MTQNIDLGYFSKLFATSTLTLGVWTTMDSRYLKKYPHGQWLLAIVYLILMRSVTGCIFTYKLLVVLRIWSCCGILHEFRYFGWVGFVGSDSADGLCDTSVREGRIKRQYREFSWRNIQIYFLKGSETVYFLKGQRPWRK